jgi:hypothetical protein
VRTPQRHPPAPDTRTISGLPIRDTADGQSALQARCCLPARGKANVGAKPKAQQAGEIAKEPERRRQFSGGLGTKRVTTAAVKLTLRQLLYPLILWLYHREPVETRGEYLIPFHFLNPADGSIEIHFGRIPGWKYGSLRLQAMPPRLWVTRKDGVHFEQDFLQDASSTLELTARGYFVLHRTGQAPFVLCQYKRPCALQLACVLAHLPPEVKSRLRFPTAADFAALKTP